MLKSVKLLAFILIVSLCWLPSNRAEAATALDPTVIGVGARALGMGRAYTAISGQPDSVFLNPAALTVLPRWGATSMYTQLLGEVNYILLGGAYPHELGTFGLGMLSASIGGLQDAVIDPNTGRLTFEAGTYSYYNNVYILSYARDVYENVSAGLNFKFFSQGFSNGDSGSGYDADLGIVYTPFEYVRVGFLQRNFIPASLGAKIRWGSKAEEGLATSSRLGVNYDLGDINLSLDYEFFPTQSSRSGLVKLGGEWWLMENLALRAGSDQDPMETNLTAGLSFLARDFQFDYAYHQYGDLAQNTTHVFSMSYGISKEEKFKEIIVIESPEDKTILFQDQVSVSGEVAPEVKRLVADGKEVAIKEGAFRFVQPLKLGKNSILLTVYGGRDKVLVEKKLRLLRLKEFSDVPEDYWARTPISVLAMEKVVSGYPDGTFKPEGNITRAEICTLLMKTKGITIKNPTRRTFKDVPVTHWAAGYIAEAVRGGVVRGYPDGTFRPNGPITRAEGVATIARFARLPAARVLESPFADVPGRHWAAKEILSAKEAGLLQYLEGKDFELNRKLTRAEVVEILSKTEILAPKVEEVLNFEEGY